ncbi:6668_t:CDS:1, partial [Funneliformis geosporum]
RREISTLQEEKEHHLQIISELDKEIKIKNTRIAELTNKCNVEESSPNDKFKLVQPPDLLKSIDFNLSFDEGEASGSGYFDKEGKEDNDLNFYGSDEGEAPKSRDFDKEGDLNFYEGREDSNDKESEDFINDNSYDDRNESDVNEGGGEEHPSPDANERRRRRDFNLRIKKRINYNYGPSPKRRRRNNS